MVSAEDLLSLEKARKECLDCKCVAEAEWWQHLLAKRQKTSRTPRRQIAESGETLLGLQSKIAAATAEINEWRKLATETAEQLKVALIDLAQ